MIAKVSSRLTIGLVLLFFYLPILVLIIFSFNANRSLVNFGGFSLQWYEELLRSRSLMSAISTTAIVAVSATIISTIIGTITAIGLSSNKKFLKEYILNVNNIPILNPEIVTAIGLMLFFVSLNFEKGLVTMLLAHIAFCIPYVVINVYPRVRRLDPNLAEAAMDLGATPMQALIKVIIPEVMPGIIAGALIAFTMSFDDFVISYFVTGNGVQNISMVVYNMSKRIYPVINALSTVLVVVIMIILIITQLIANRKNKGKII